VHRPILLRARAAGIGRPSRPDAPPGGGAHSIGPYAAGLAVANGAGVVDYVDRSSTRRETVERVTTVTADWEDAPTAYATRTTELVLRRDPVSAG
jgi:alcohol dehydrogenase